jgi:hypothetical protein
MSAILRRQSSNEDLYSLHFGQAVAIYDLTRSDVDGICSTYKRVFVSAAKSVLHPTNYRRPGTKSSDEQTSAR